MLDGKCVAKLILTDLKERIKKLKTKPTLSVIQVGDNEASSIYVRNKIQIAKDIGFNSNVFKYDNISKEDLIKAIHEINKISNGVLIQLPCQFNVLDEIDPIKDVDGLTSYNLGKLFKGEPIVLPCTPKGIIRLLKYYNICLEGALCVVIGRSNIVGKPMTQLLLKENATVIQAHSYTNNLQELTKQADIIISATGTPHFITKEYVSPGAVLIDVGITRVNGKIMGDIHPECYDGNYTPVPGGVGPMTIAMLMENTYELYLLQNKVI